MASEKSPYGKTLTRTTMIKRLNAHLRQEGLFVSKLHGEHLYRLKQLSTGRAYPERLSPNEVEALARDLCVIPANKRVLKR